MPKASKMHDRKKQIAHVAFYLKPQHTRKVRLVFFAQCRWMAAIKSDIGGKAIKSLNRSHSKYIISGGRWLFLRAYVASHQRLLKSVHASSPSISLCLTPCYISNLFLYSFCFLLFRENHMFTYAFLSLLSIIDATVGIPPSAPLPGQGTHPQLPGCLSHKFTPSFQEAVTKDRLMCGSKSLPLP